MSYSERAFAGPDASGRTYPAEPVSHCADWQEHHRLARLERARIRAVASREWRAMPEPMRAIDHARAHLAAMPAENRARLEREWAAEPYVRAGDAA